MFRAYGKYEAEQKKAEAAAKQLPPHRLEQSREGPGADGTEKLKER